MNVASVVMLLVGLFGLVLLILSLLSLFNAGNIPIIGGAMYGGWFLVIVSLIITAGGFVGFSRMRRR